MKCIHYSSFLLGVSSFFLVTTLPAQNLVPNPSFEYYLDCPANISQLENNSVPWLNPNSRTPDLFSSCRGDSCGALSFASVCVPYNIKGGELAKEGECYAGIFSGAGYFSREYLQVELTSALVAGETYEVSFFVSLADNYDRAIEKLGAFVSVDRVTALNLLPVNPQVTSPEDEFLSNKEGWTEIKGELVAEGGESYLTIGNFQAEPDLEYISGLGGTDTFAYYFVDAISLRWLDPALNIVADSIICQGDSTLLSIDSSSDYMWVNGNAPQQVLGINTAIWVKPTTNTTYLAFNENDTVSVRVRVVDYPTADLGPDTLLCQGALLLLDASFPEATYVWQDSSSQATFQSYEIGTYSVTVDLYGCAARDTIEVLADVLDIPELGPDKGLCEDEVLHFDVEHPEAIAYRWENGFNKSNRAIDEVGFYWVERIGERCITRDSIYISDGTFSFDLGRDTFFCEGDVVLLDPEIPHAEYEWSVPSFGQVLSVEEPGLYWVEVFKEDCDFRDSIFLSSKPRPVINFPGDTILCGDERLFIDLFYPNAEYEWSTGATSSSILVDAPGRYAARVYLEECGVEGELNVLYEDFSSADLGEDLEICEGDEVLLDAFAEGAHYLWNTGEQSPTLLVSEFGTYSVELNGLQCTFTDEITISKTDRNCDCLLYIPNVFSPNYDGVHDDFVPLMNCELSDYRFSIFSRWGEKVFETKEVGKPWDGRFRGQLVGPGVYVYQVAFYSHRQDRDEVESGTVTVFR